jgi:hypothetical protein
MTTILVKSDNLAPVKIKLSEPSESGLYQVEINRRRQNRTGQKQTLYSRENIIGMICDALGWDAEALDVEPVPPVQIRKGARVTATAYDEDLFPRRLKTSTVSKPFLDYRGVWRVFCLGEKKAVKLDLVTVE